MWWGTGALLPLLVTGGMDQLLPKWVGVVWWWAAVPRIALKQA